MHVCTYEKDQSALSFTNSVSPHLHGMPQPLRVFVDGSFTNLRRRGGVGCFVPEWPALEWRALPRCDDSWHAECQALIWGYQWARPNAGRRESLLLLTDHQTLAQQWLRSRGRTRRSLSPEEADVRQRMVCDAREGLLRLQWVPRTQNGVADRLSKVYMRNM